MFFPFRSYINSWVRNGTRVRHLLALLVTLILQTEQASPSSLSHAAVSPVPVFFPVFSWVFTPLLYICLVFSVGESKGLFNPAIKLVI